MKKKGDKFIALALVFALMILSGNMMGAERKGVEVKIQKTDGQEISGELISVRKNALVILDEATEVDTTVNLNLVDSIHVNNKSLMFELGLGSFLLAGAARMMAHSRTKDIDTEPGQHQVQGVWYWGAGGAVVGVLAGAFFGIDKNIQVQGVSEAALQESLLKLSKKARIKGLQ